MQTMTPIEASVIELEAILKYAHQNSLSNGLPKLDSPMRENVESIEAALDEVDRLKDKLSDEGMWSVEEEPEKRNGLWLTGGNHG